MLTLKTVISILVTIVGAFAAAVAGGAFSAVHLTLSAGTVAIIQAVDQAVAVLGVSPYQFQPPIPEYLRGLGLIMAAVQVAHLGSTTPTTPHSVFWVAFGCVGVLVSMLGKSPLPHAPAAKV